MRVLFLTDSLSDLDGIGRYTTRLVAALEECIPRFEPRFLLARKHRPNSPSLPAHWRWQVALPPDYYLYMSPARFWASTAWSLPQAAWAAREVDLVHATKDYPHSWLAAQAARLAARPCVATAHGTYSVAPLDQPRHRARAVDTFARLDGLVCVSNYTRHQVESRLPPGALPRERVVVVGNAVRAEHYAAPRELGARPWHGRAYTLTIAEVKERKGHHLGLTAFLAVAKDRPALHHYIVGNCVRDEYHLGLLRQVEQAGCQGRVHFLGNVSEDEKVDLLQRALVFLHTPVTAKDGGFEGFGIVYLEASACGTPSIGTRDCGAEDAILDGATGLLVEPTVEATRAALARLVDDESQRRELGEGARRHAQRSSWRDNAERVAALYAQALERRGRR
jgi:glycosyltransferase involved in cell wall biosynthesis